MTCLYGQWNTEKEKVETFFVNLKSHVKLNGLLKRNDLISL